MLALLSTCQSPWSRRGASLSLEYILLLVGIALELTLVAIAIKIRLLRTHPAFFVYLCWSLLSDLFFGLGRSYRSPLSTSVYIRLYEIETLIDTAIILAVLTELAALIFRPVLQPTHRNYRFAITASIALLGLPLWSLAAFGVPAALSPPSQLFVRLQLTVALLRVVTLAGIAALSVFLSLGWRNRELQIATGLFFYSLIALAISLAHSHQPAGAQYHLLDLLSSIGYLGMLGYWIASFGRRTGA